ncbi:MAG: glycosyltransferase [Bryobacterales bacterium]|nr:glycosyltransferase [Bryobacterales bacterium]
MFNLCRNLGEMEQTRETYWESHPGTSSIKLRWRALAVRHCFHVLPGESILEIGAGSGLWTGHLTAVHRGENPITAAVFDDGFAERLASRNLPNTRVVRVRDLSRDLPEESFDYIVGTAILCHDRYPQTLRALYSLLKPGGQILFFEANYWNPQVWVKNNIKPIGRWAGQARCQIGMRKYHLLKIASQQGFTRVDIIPYDIVHANTPRFLIPRLQSLAFILEHTPLVREFCGTLYIWATKPGVRQRPRVSLATHPELARSTSVVVPCHNEEMNVPRLIGALLEYYDPYIHEIIIVNDNSTDGTAAAALEAARTEPRVKLINRTAPNGVGRALRDGYRFATGRYILTMDSDFAHIVPELRDLFDAVAEGCDGAIGSRFSHESLLVNYPFVKILCNRAFHLLLNLLLPTHVRDISNNLKLYRAEILKNLQIRENHFAANAETGLKPILAGYRLREVPISWINRTVDMGSSTFRIAGVAPNYFRALMSTVRDAWRNRAAPGAERIAQADQ